MSSDKLGQTTTRQQHGSPRLATIPHSNPISGNLTLSRRFPYRTIQNHELVRSGGISKNSNYHWLRLRSGRPTRSYSWDELVEYPPRNDENDSDCDSASSTSDSCSQSDTDDEELSIQDLDQAIRLDYESICADLIQATWPHVREWIESVRYVAPPDDRLPPQNRFKSPGRRCGPAAFYEQKEDQKDPNTILIVKADGYFHLACPFYISNPTKHRNCLLEHDMQSIEDVIRHVSRHHTEPPYCPRCRQTFTRAMDRDRHFLSQRCDIRTWVQVEGVNTYQKTRLVKKDKIILGERKRWLRIWRTAFPNAKGPSRSHYLNTEEEVKLSIARDYWEVNGKEIVSDFLAQNGHVKLLADLALSAICTWTLEDLLYRLTGTNEATPRNS